MVLAVAGCSKAGDPARDAPPRTRTLGARSGVDTAIVVAPRPQLVPAPCTTSAKAGEPAALWDPYQYVQSGAAFVHTSIILVEFSQTASPAARARVLRRIQGCVVGRDEGWVYVRIPTDTTAQRQYELADSLSETSTVDFVTPHWLYDAECAIEGPRDRCTEEARRTQLQEWRRSYTRPANR